MHCIYFGNFIEILVAVHRRCSSAEVCYSLVYRILIRPLAAHIEQCILVHIVWLSSNDLYTQLPCGAQ